MAKMVYKGVVTHMPKGQADTPYNDHLKMWDDVVGEHVQAKKMWQKIAYMMAGLSCAMILTVFYALSLPKTVPYVIQVAPWGEVKAVGTVGGTYQVGEVTEITKTYYLRKIIENLRSIPTDDKILSKNISTAFQMLTNKSAPVVTSELQNEEIYKLYGTVRREVMIESIINVTGNAWQVDWIETKYGITNGKIEEQLRMRAIMTMVMGQPILKMDTENPLGIYIDSYQRQVISGGNK